MFVSLVLWLQLTPKQKHNKNRKRRKWNETKLEQWWCDAFIFCQSENNNNNKSSQQKLFKLKDVGAPLLVISSSVSREIFISRMMKDHKNWIAQHEGKQLSESCTPTTKTAKQGCKLTMLAFRLLHAFCAALTHTRTRERASRNNINLNNIKQQVSKQASKQASNNKGIKKGLTDSRYWPT